MMVRPAVHVRIASLVALALLVVLCAGCGQLNRNDYIHAMQQITRQMDADGGDPTFVGSDPTPQEVRKQQRAFRKAADRVEQLDAPDDIAKAQRQYVRSLRSFAHDLGLLARAIEDADGDPTRLAENIDRIQRRMQEDVARLGDAADSYRESGYAAAITSAAA